MSSSSIVRRSSSKVAFLTFVLLSWLCCFSPFSVDTYPWTATIILQSLGFSEQFISSDSHFEMDRVENLLGTLLSQNALPYFVGSQLVEAVEYSYKEVAKAKASIMYQVSNH